MSLVGNWISATTSIWVAYSLTNDAFWVGFIPFIGQLPVIAIAPIAGVWADRIQRRSALVKIQCSAMALAAILAMIDFAGYLSISALAMYSLIRGALMGCEQPLRQAFLLETIDDKSLTSSAIGAYALLFNVARMLGPALAGMLLASSQPAICYIIHAASFTPLLLTLLLIETPVRTSTAPKKHPLLDFSDGLRYARSEPRIRVLLLLMPAFCFVGYAANILTPIYAKDVFRAGPDVFGIMHLSAGAGSLVAMIYFNHHAATAGMHRIIHSGLWLSAAGLLMFACAPLPWALIALFATGAAATLVMTGCNAELQLSVEEDKRGRMLGLLLAGQGALPVGSLLLGWAASNLGSYAPILFSGVFVGLLAGLFSRVARRSSEAVRILL